MLTNDIHSIWTLCHIPHSHLTITSRAEMGHIVGAEIHTQHRRIMLDPRLRIHIRQLLPIITELVTLHAIIPRTSTHYVRLLPLVSIQGETRKAVSRWVRKLNVAVLRLGRLLSWLLTISESTKARHHSSLTLYHTQGGLILVFERRRLTQEV